MNFKAAALLMLSVFTLKANAQTNELSMSANNATPSATLSNFLFIPVVGYASTGYSGITGINGGSFKNLEFPSAGMTVVVGKGAWQFESGLIYNTIGTELSFTNVFNQKSSVKSQSTYIDIPVLARWTFMGDRRYRMFARGGVVAGILMEAQVEQSFQSGVATNSTTNKNKDTFHDYDARLSIGVGGSYRFTPSISLNTSVDFQEGLTKLTTDKLYDGVDVRSRSLGVTVGLGFRI